MKKYLVLVAAVFMLSSCSNRPNDKGEYVIKPGNSAKELHVKYTADGNIEYIQEYKDGKPDGMLMNYHKQNPKNISFIENDKNQGCGVVFHNNGNVNNFGQYVDGQKTGWFYVFNTDEEGWGSMSNTTMTVLLLFLVLAIAFGVKYYQNKKKGII